MNKKIDVNKFRAAFSTTERKKFLKYLIDAGLDIDSSTRTIEGYYKGRCIFTISRAVRYQVEVTGSFRRLEDEDIDIAGLYEKIMAYAGLELEDRIKEIEIIRGADD